MSRFLHVATPGSSPMNAAIFDLDGTLIDSMEVDCKLYIDAIISELGPVEFRPGFNDYDDVTDIGILRQLIVDNSLSVDSGTIDLVRSKFVDSLRGHVDSEGPIPTVHGAKDFINRLNSSNEYCVAVATGCWRESAILKLETSGFDLSGIPLATCDDAISRIEIMKRAMQQLESKCDSVTYFGDREWDARACAQLGWKFVAVGSYLGGIESYEGFEMKKWRSS